jgi:hypothetical protein
LIISDMRREILKTYPGDNWRRKVDKMPDSQVIAIYHSIMNKKRTKTVGRGMPIRAPFPQSEKNYYTCSRCGANLDPGETCDCQ